LATQRIITMREVMGDNLPGLPAIYRGLLEGFAEGLGIAPEWSVVTPYEEELADRAYREEIGTDAYVEMLDTPKMDGTLVSASLTTRGCTIRADIRLEGPRRELIREMLLTGDFFVTPPRIIFDLEAAFRGLDVANAEHAVDEFFAHTPASFSSLELSDFRSVIGAALEQRRAMAESAC
jgi:lipoate-protein ligase A